MANELQQSAQEVLTGGIFSSISKERILPAVISLVVGILAVMLLTKLFDRGLKRTRMANRLHGFIKSTLKILLYTIVVLISLSTLGYDMSSLVALLSVVSLALSLAIQGVLSNVAGGIQVLSSRPFNVDDYVEIAGIEGFVSEIGMIYSKLKTREGQIVYLPNNEVANSKIINYSGLGKRKIILDINASYDSPADGVRAALLSAARAEGVLQEPQPIVKVISYDDSSIHYMLEIWCNPTEYWDVSPRVNELVRSEFNKTGMIMTYPHLNVHLEK